MSNINELSKNKIRKYLGAAKKDEAQRVNAMGNSGYDDHNAMEDSIKSDKRWKFIKKAEKKIGEETVNETKLSPVEKKEKRMKRFAALLSAEKQNQQGHNEENLVEDGVDSNSKSIKNVKLALAIKSASAKAHARHLKANKKLPSNQQMYSGWSRKDMTDMMEIADLAHAGMAIAGVVAAGGAEAAIHHATGDIYHGAKKKIGGLIQKFKARKSNVASVTSQKTPNTTPANDNSPSLKPKVKTTIMHGEEIQPSFNEVMLAQAKRLGIASQIAYYERMCEAQATYPTKHRKTKNQYAYSAYDGKRYKIDPNYKKEEKK